MNQSQDDISVDGPGSPVSLRKFIERNPNLRDITLLVDGTGAGIAKDADNTIYITEEECRLQATHYITNLFNGKQIPAYLFRYLSYMFIGDALEYNNDQEVVNAFRSGKLKEGEGDYLYIRNLIFYGLNNPEAMQVIGLIQLTAGPLNIARKNNTSIRLYYEHPEVHLHPKRQSRFMSMLMKLRKEYGGIEDESDTRQETECIFS